MTAPAQHRDYLELAATSPKPYSLAVNNYTLPQISPERDSFPLNDDSWVEQLLENQKEVIRQQLESQMSDIERQIGMLEATNHEGASDLALDNLRTQLGNVSAALQGVMSASNLAELANISNNMSVMASNTEGIKSASAVAGSVESGVLMAEVTIEKIHEMSVSYMAYNFTAAHFSQMSYEQLDAVREQTNAFMSEATERGNRVDSMLESTGQTSKLYRETSVRLSQEEEEARRTGDRIELAKTQYLQSTNRALELESLGMHEEATAERAHGEKALDNLRVVAREVATREAREAGMSPKQAEEYIAAKEAKVVTSATQTAKELTEEYGANSKVYEQENKDVESDYEETIVSANIINTQYTADKMADVAEFSINLDAFNMGDNNVVDPAIVAAASQYKAGTTKITPSDEELDPAESKTPNVQTADAKLLKKESGTSVV